MNTKPVLALTFLAACQADPEDLPGLDAGSNDASERSDSEVDEDSGVTGDSGSDAGVSMDSGVSIDAAMSMDAGIADVGVTQDAAVDAGLARFSFFVTSLAALQDISGKAQGFGGDLSFGETGPGAGLRGADKLCATIAERSLPGSGAKGWRAFLSAAHGEDGNQVDAIDRIGEGPWYDRLGRLLAANKADLLHDRPVGADLAIANDFPNEDGVPNHQPDPTQARVDNHDTLTGTNDQGRLYSATATCLDWTSAKGDRALEGKPRVGHSWPRRGGPGGGPGGDVNPANWMSSLIESGCAPGVNLIEQGPPMESSTTVGSGGGYGGFYCFALTP